MATPNQFNKILQDYRNLSFSERDKGDRFERLIQAYLQTDPTYSNTLKYVWMWNEFPGKKDFGGKDTGIDLVALTFEGDYWAIQCKCFAENGRINKAEVDSFLSTSSRDFKNDQLQTVSFSKRIWVSTTNNWSSNAEETIKNQNPPVTRINLTDLQQAPVEWERLQKGITGDLARTDKKTLFKHQEEALNKTHEHFKENDRGKLIMACGTGKSLVSLWVAEQIKPQSILVLLPSLALVRQILKEWCYETSFTSSSYICICSDNSVTKNMDAFTSDLSFPVTTDTDELASYLNDTSGTKIVFSTYQSAKVVAKATKNNFIFDFGVFDEAHKTAGREGKKFSFALNDENIKIKKRLFLTATPKHYSIRKNNDSFEDNPVYSMDKEDIYGRISYKLTFAEAAKKGII